MSASVLLMQWAGGKSRLAPQLREALNVGHKIMVEPFLGAGGLLLNRSTWDADQVVNDLDSGIYSIWKTIGSSRYKEFAEKVSKFPISPEIFDKCRAIKKNGFEGFDIMERAVITYYLVIYSFNGRMQSMSFRNKPGEWRELKEKKMLRLFKNIHIAHSQASQARILNTDARVVIAAYKDNPDALIYIDSPYVYELMGKKKDLYGEGFTTNDQIQMLNMIKNAGAKICISGYRGGSLLYDRYLNKDTGWHTYMIGEVTRSAGMYGAKKGNPHNKAQEFIWTNYDVPGGASNFFNTYDFALDWDDIGDFMEQRKMA